MLHILCQFPPSAKLCNIFLCYSPLCYCPVDPIRVKQVLIQGKWCVCTQNKLEKKSSANLSLQ